LHTTNTIKQQKTKKDYLYSNVEYEITNVEYYYDNMIFFVDDLKNDIKSIDKLKKSINQNLKKYKDLKDNQDFKYAGLDKILSESKTIKKTIENEYIRYLNNGKSILDKSKSYIK
jgi:hypothetical protein